MNIQLDNVVSGLRGTTGAAILRAVAAGERDPRQLAALRDTRLRADKEAAARRLQGNWREEHVFALTQALEHYDFLSQQIKQCNQCIEQQLVGLPTLADSPPQPVKGLWHPHRTKNQQIVLHQALYGIMGVDLTAIPAIGIETVLVMAGETGSDLSRFPDEANFCSRLNAAPPACISGGKRLKGQKPRVFSRAGQALRQAALNARNSQRFIGASHRARLARMDGASAIKAAAHQLARLIYAMLTKGQPYVEKGIEAFKVRIQDCQLKALQKKAQKLGLESVERA